MKKTNKFQYGQTTEEMNYWIKNRSILADLYKSEKYFFEKILPNVGSVLDIGCAAGGSALFCREIRTNLQYFGIDVSSNLIDIAKKRFAESKYTSFFHYDGETIPFEDSTIEFVFSFGVFHHLINWKELIAEALRVSSKYFLFDIRCWQNSSIVDGQTSFQKLALSGEWDQKSTIPYNLISFNELLDFLKNFKSAGHNVNVFGYWGKPTSLAVTPANEVLMTSILIEKNSILPEIHMVLE